MPDLSPEQSVSCPENLKAEAVEKAANVLWPGVLWRSQSTPGSRSDRHLRRVLDAVADDLYRAGYVRALADAEERIDDLTGWEHTRDEVRAALAALKEGKQA